MKKPWTTHEIWIHKEKDVMCEYLFKRSDVLDEMERTVSIGFLTYDGNLAISKSIFIGCRIIFNYIDGAISFPDDFIKVGDV